MVLSLKDCSICESQVEKGINILQSFICDNCLDKISNTQVDDPEYNNILTGNKKVWVSNEVAK